MLKIAEITDDKKGALVDLVKTEIVEGKTSLAPVGTRIKGVLAKDIELGEPIYIKTEGEDFRHYTSEVMGIAFPNGTERKMVITTETSVYEMKIK